MLRRLRVTLFSYYYCFSLLVVDAMLLPYALPLDVFVYVTRRRAPCLRRFRYLLRHITLLFIDIDGCCLLIDFAAIASATLPMRALYTMPIRHAADVAARFCCLF